MENIYIKIYNHRKNLKNLAEIGNKEFKTSKYIKEYLESLNIEYENYLETAIVGIIRGKNKRKSIAFRSDMDGLKTEQGIKHICGHDGHMSILLGLIEFISINKNHLHDDIVFIFQPAEEGPGGAQNLIGENIITKYKIEQIYGLHIYPEIETGFVGTRSGYFMAQIGDFDIDIEGKSGHGAMPQNGVDSIVIASNLIGNIQSIVSRNVSPIDNAVVSVGLIRGGSKRNIIAQNTRLEGTIRTFKPQTYRYIKERMVSICNGAELTYNCKINVNIKDDYPAVNNNEMLYEEFKNIINKSQFVELDPLMISEDFSYYQREIPGLFFMIGSKNIKKGFTNGLHSINFDYEDNVLKNGLDIFIKLLKHKGSLNIV